MPKKRPTRQEVVRDEVEVSERDYVMARLAAARVAAKDALDAIDQATEMFVYPDEDTKGKERTELIATALEASGSCSRALEAAEEVLEDVDMEEREPWDDEEDDDEDPDDDKEGDDD